MFFTTQMFIIVTETIIRTIWIPLIYNQNKAHGEYLSIASKFAKKII